MRDDWVEIELGRVCEYSKGKKPKILVTEYSKRTPYPYINIKAFEKNIFSEYTDGTKCNLCENGDLLIVWDGARAGLTGKAKKGAIGSTLMKIEPKYGMEKNYLFYFLLSLYKKLNSNPRGVGIPHVEPNILWSSNVLIPDKPTQRAIVAKIEKLFSDLDNGIANLQTAKAKLEIYRQAVLKKAFEGMRYITFGQFIRESKNGLSKRKGDEGKYIKILRLADVKNLGINYQSPRAIRLTEQEFNKYALREDDLVAIRVNGSKDLVGRLIYVNKADENESWGFCDHFIRISLNKERCLPKFYFYYFQTLNVRNFIHKNMVSTAGQNTVSQVTIKAVDVPKIDVAKQTQIVMEIESRLSVCDKLAESIGQGLEKAEALRQSILKKAFAGHLLSEAELEACRREPDWEPAEKLLERIKKDKR